jgi:hypothetical protein
MLSRRHLSHAHMCGIPRHVFAQGPIIVGVIDASLGQFPQNDVCAVLAWSRHGVRTADFGDKDTHRFMRGNLPEALDCILLGVIAASISTGGAQPRSGVYEGNVHGYAVRIYAICLLFHKLVVLQTPTSILPTLSSHRIMHNS